MEMKEKRKELCQYIGEVEKIKDHEYRMSRLIKSLVLGDGIKSIGVGAFEKCSQLESLVLSETVTVIKKRAFKDCVALKEVSFKEGLKNIEAEAFSGCAELKSVTLPDSLETLDHSAFARCPQLSKIVIGSNTILDKVPDYMLDKLMIRPCKSK